MSVAKKEKSRGYLPVDWGERRTTLRTTSLLSSMKLELTSSHDKADKAVPSVTGGRGSAPFACQALVGIDSTDVLKKSILPDPKMVLKATWRARSGALCYG